MEYRRKWLCGVMSTGHMGIPKYEAAFESGDKEQLDAILHDDCKFYPHVGGAVMTKGDIMAFAGMGAVQASPIASCTRTTKSAWSLHRPLCQRFHLRGRVGLYRFKDGKIVHVETGATPLSDDYKLIGQVNATVVLTATKFGRLVLQKRPVFDRYAHQEHDRGGDRDQDVVVNGPKLVAFDKGGDGRGDEPQTGMWGRPHRLQTTPAVH